MKNLKLIAIMACAIFALSSCEKELLQVPAVSEKVKTTVEKSGGGQDEQPIIIYGFTQNSSSVAIENAEVKLYDAGTNQIISTDYTDSEGNFEFSELIGTYYFVIDASAYSIFQSADLNFPLNNGITFTLQ
jgi:hypothetical protein